MNDVILNLTGEILMIGIVSKLLQEPPEREWVQNLLIENLFDETPYAAEQADVVRGLSLIQTWIDDQWQKDPNQALTVLETDYLRLFIGAGKVLAPPWESVYSDDDRLVFQEQTLQVRNWFRKYGLESHRIYHEPDDHIGLELSFIAHLDQLALEAVTKNEINELTWLLHDKQSFLRGHPLTWVNKWCDLVEKNARTDFYRGIAFLVKGTLKESEEFLDDTLSKLSPGTTHL